jgi:hypothetical protein
MGSTQLRHRSNRFSGQSLPPPSPSSPSPWTAHSSVAAQTGSQVSPYLPRPHRPPAHGQHTAPLPLKPVLRSVPTSPVSIVPQHMGSPQLCRPQTGSQVSPYLPCPHCPQPMGSAQLRRRPNRFSGQSLPPPSPSSPSPWAAHSSAAAQTGSQVSPYLTRAHCPPAHGQHTAPSPLKPVLRSVPASPVPIVPQPMGSTQLRGCSNRFSGQFLPPPSPSSPSPWAAHSSVAAQTGSQVSPYLPCPHRPPAHGQHTAPPPLTALSEKWSSFYVL